MAGMAITHLDLEHYFLNTNYVLYELQNRQSPDDVITQDSIAGSPVITGNENEKVRQEGDEIGIPKL